MLLIRSRMQMQWDVSERREGEHFGGVWGDVCQKNEEMGKNLLGWTGRK